MRKSLNKKIRYRRETAGCSMLFKIASNAKFERFFIYNEDSVVTDCSPTDDRQQVHGRWTMSSHSRVINVDSTETERKIRQRGLPHGT